MWKLSLFLNIALCFISFLPAYFDHGKRWVAFKSAKIGKEKWRTGLEFLLVNWGLPVFALMLMVINSMETYNSNKKVDELQNFIVTQSDQLARTEAKANKLESEVKPRRLTNAQSEKLIKLLTDDPGTVAIVSTLMDAESSDFANDFDVALREAHWQTMRIKNYTQNEYGVSIGIFEGTRLGDAKRLSDALSLIGISHVEETFDAKDQKTTSPWFQSDVLYLVIKHKPMPSLK